MTDLSRIRPQERSANGFIWSHADADAHFFTDGKLTLRILPRDFHNGAFELLTMLCVSHDEVTQ